MVTFPANTHQTRMDVGIWLLAVSEKCVCLKQSQIPTETAHPSEKRSDFRMEGDHKPQKKIRKSNNYGNIELLLDFYGAKMDPYCRRPQWGRKNELPLI